MIFADYIYVNRTIMNGMGICFGVIILLVFFFEICGWLKARKEKK